MKLARTVLGDVPAECLGAVNYHEHVFQASPLLPGEELDDPERSVGELESLARSGFSSVIDATPVGLGRRSSILPEASRRSGLTIVAATGAHRQEHYPDQHWVTEVTEVELADLFLAEVSDGLRVADAPGATEVVSGCRAGIVKTGIGYWRISGFERRVLAAAAAAHGATNVPIMVHLEHGSAAHEVLDLLTEQDVDLNAVVLAHADRNLDPVLHAELAARGAYLGYDGFARTKDRSDAELLDCLLATAAAGAASRILVGGDVARRSRYLCYGGLPGLEYLGCRVLPRLRRLDSSLTDAVTVTNPARLLTRFADATCDDPQQTRSQ